jgi:hypothetical protein
MQKDETKLSKSRHTSYPTTPAQHEVLAAPKSQSRTSKHTRRLEERCPLLLSSTPFQIMSMCRTPVLSKQRPRRIRPSARSAHSTSSRGFSSSYPLCYFSFVFVPPTDDEHRFLFPCSVLAFQSSTGGVFQIEYPSITLHATSRGDSDPFVYCQLDESPAADAAPEDGDEGDTSSMRGLSLTPQDLDARAFRHPLFFLLYAKL